MPPCDIHDQEGRAWIDDIAASEAAWRDVPIDLSGVRVAGMVPGYVALEHNLSVTRYPRRGAWRNQQQMITPVSLTHDQAKRLSAQRTVLDAL